MSQLSSAIILSILGQMTQDNSVTGNQHVTDDINRLTQYVQTGIDPGGTGSPGLDPEQVGNLLQTIESNVNAIGAGLVNIDPNAIAQQVQTLLDSVKALQQYIQTGQNVDPSTAQTAPNEVENAVDPANPLARHQQNFPSKG